MVKINKKIIFTLSASLLSLVSLKMQVNAADPDPTTEGKIKFIEGSGPDTGPITLIKPGTEKTLITIDEKYGSRTTDGLRFSFVPSIDFGEVEISLNDQLYYAKPIPFKLGEADSTNPTEYIPPFMQVINESGEDHQFKVLVSATKFESSSNHVLDSSRILISDFSARNNLLDVGVKGTANEGLGNVDAEVAGLLKTPDLSTLPDQRLVVPITGSGESQILSSLDGELTRGTASSVVFGSNYSPTRDYTEAEKMASIMLKVNSTDKPKKEGYTSIITWQLEDTL